MVAISEYVEDASNRFVCDEERKYGEIPARIYMLYLKSCGLCTIGVFCISALAWQATKIYLDVWLRNWTDIEQTQRFTDVWTISSGHLELKIELRAHFLVSDFILFRNLCPIIADMHRILNDLSAIWTVCRKQSPTLTT